MKGGGGEKRGGEIPQLTEMVRNRVVERLKILFNCRTHLIVTGKCQKRFLRMPGYCKCWSIALYFTYPLSCLNHRLEKNMQCYTRRQGCLAVPIRCENIVQISMINWWEGKRQNIKPKEQSDPQHPLCQ